MHDYMLIFKMGCGVPCLLNHHMLLTVYTFLSFLPNMCAMTFCKMCFLNVVKFLDFSISTPYGLVELTDICKLSATDQLQVFMHRPRQFLPESECLQVQCLCQLLISEDFVLM